MAMCAERTSSGVWSRDGACSGHTTSMQLESAAARTIPTSGGSIVVSAVSAALLALALLLLL
jgi:hypothetical protein